MADILETGGLTVEMGAAEFQAYDVIRVSLDQPADEVSLRITDAGALNLVQALEGQRAATVYASVDGNEITTGEGDDTLYGNIGDDTLNGGDGNDTIYDNDGGLGGGNDIINGGAGNDRIFDLYGSEKRIDAGSGNDYVEVGFYDPQVPNEDGSYNLVPPTGTLDGGAGIDTLFDSYAYLAGREIVNFEILATGGSVVYGYAEQFQCFDQIVYSNSDLSSAVAIQLDNEGALDLSGKLAFDSDGDGIADSARSITVYTSFYGNEVTGGAGNDTLIGSETFFPGLASDTLNGGDGDDRLDGSVGDDTLFGGAGKDTLIGGTGNDLLDGGSGQDIFRGGAGNDTFVGGGGVDSDIADYSQDYLAGGTRGIRVNQLGSGPQDGLPADTVIDAFGDTDSIANVRNIIATRYDDRVFGGTHANTITLGAGNDYAFGNDGSDTISGEDGNDELLGGRGSDTLSGGAGNDTLDGGGGADKMYGLTDNDTFIVDDAGDLVIEYSSQGTDTVRASISYTLTANVENLVLTGNGAIDGTGNILANAITGNDAANRLAGGFGNDTLTGNGGNDTLDGGAGADAMAGGTGDDTYYVDNRADTVTELNNQGSDTVVSTIAYTLGNFVENLTLGGSAAINGTGNGLGNILIGNAAANSLSGGAGNDRLDGGLGNDRLIGGTGDDIYVVRDAGDLVFENANGGTDKVEAYVSHSLSANVENLDLMGSSAINGTGNGLANMLTGNGADNVLSGGAGQDTLTGGAGNDRLDGGTGYDRMFGGTGDDTYVVDNVFEQVIENAGEGIDRIESSVSLRLVANVENLTLTGTSALDGTGNGLANAILGNAADNRLDGLSGNDILTGGAGRDTFVLSTALNARTNVDTITDFNLADDVISLAAGVFVALGSGPLAQSAFALGTVATTADQHIVYDQSTGRLYYDADGAGGAAQTLFADIANKAALTFDDFLVA